MCLCRLLFLALTSAAGQQWASWLISHQSSDGGKFRLIHHLSHPKRGSVNDAIPDHMCSVQYTSFDKAVCLVHKSGISAELAKCDIKLAFRLLPVHPDDFELLGHAFEGQFYVDRLFGLLRCF